MKKDFIALMAVILSFSTHAEEPESPSPQQGFGKITFSGAVIDAPCSIDADSVDQKINLGQISNVALKNGGSSTPKSFVVRLKNCSTDTAKNVTTTFTGPEGVNGKLGISGSVSGAGIVLTDGSGEKIKLGKPTKGQLIQDGENTLSFSAYVQGDGGAVSPGEFIGITDFTLAYQ